MTRHTGNPIARPSDTTLERTDSPTERRLPESYDIDTLTSLQILERINAEDAKVPPLVRAVLPQLATVVDHGVDIIRAGGRIHYFGAGTSGRFGVLDAVEVAPTFGIAPGVIVAHLAGNADAMISSAEGAEDDVAAGDSEAAASVEPGDMVIGLAASGRTPYVLGALRRARERGALTVAVSSNPSAPIAELADHHICTLTGPEVITGSTRMKAGMAQKLVLGCFSTALMVRLGRTYSNLMVDMIPSNEKLRARAIRLLEEASGASAPDAARALGESDGEVRTALLVLMSGLEPDSAREQLGNHRTLREAVEHLRPAAPSRRTMAHCVVGIDIGSSGYRIAVLDDDGTREPIRGKIRPIVSESGLDLHAVMNAIGQDLSEMVRREGLTVAGVGVGVAGAHSFPGLAETLRYLQRLIGVDTIAGFGDGTASYVGALGFEAGAVLAAGTGSVAVATDGKTLWKQVDGLGHLLGDYGSGAWLGRRALEVALRHAAARTSGSVPLRVAAERRFGSVSELVNDLYRTTEQSAMLASFVPDVVAAAPSDQAAAGLLREAADELAITLLNTAEGLTDQLAAVGGLVCSGGPLRPLLEERLAQSGHRLTEAHGSAAEGSARIIRALTTGSLPAAFQDRILAVT